jgi:integrase/recombinase XerD
MEFDPMPTLISPENFEKFVQERKYLFNVSPKTEQIYRAAWQKWQKHGPEPVAFVAGMRESGMNATGCNIYIRSMNAFLRWAGHAPIRKLKEEQKVPPTFTPADIQKLLKYKPSGKEKRTYTLMLLLLDTGVRINEALSLQKPDLDFDNLLFLVKGKGRKERLVPFSLELRKHLWKHLERNPHLFVFSSRDGKKLMYRNVLRAVRALCLSAKITPPERLLHSFRHTFAVTYIRNGGAVFHLQRALGHSSLGMSRRYANLTTDDLIQMQQKVSVLQAASR